MMEAIIVKYDEGQLGFVRYTILITQDHHSWTIVRRFNDFLPLHEALIRAFPRFQATLPARRWFGRFNPDFLNARRSQLQAYLDFVMNIVGLSNCSEVRAFFEIDKQSGGEAGSRPTQEESLDDIGALRGEVEQARVAAILEETTKAFINTSLPLYQVSIEQIEPAELSQQRTKILQRTAGFRGQSSSVVQRMLCSRWIQERPSHSSSASSSLSSPFSAAGSGGGLSATGVAAGRPTVVDILSSPTRMALGVQGQLLEKQGLGVADDIREARQVRTGGDERDLMCDLREERPSG